MHKIKQIKDLASKSDLIRHNAIFFIGTMGIAVFNYLYYPVIGRLVTVPDFGEIQAVISLFMQLGIVLTAFGYVVTNIVSNASNRDANSLILRLEQIMLVVSGFRVKCTLWRKCSSTHRNCQSSHGSGPTFATSQTFSNTSPV